MSKDFDVNQQVQSDIDTIKRLNGTDVSDLSPGAIIEYVLWLFAVVTVIGMIVAMPWVGQDKLIPGTVWLGYSLACILLFGFLAGLIRWIRHSADDIDASMNRQFDTTRGR